MGQRAPDGARPLAITGCGILSSIGVGFDEFTSGFSAGRDGRTSITALYDEPMPADTACVIPSFKASAFLGRKGTGSFDRITSLVVVACGLALKDSRLDVNDENRDRVGITIGTSTGSAKSASDYTRETLVQERPYLVNPMLFPNTILNCPAAQAAIWYSLKGVNATISGGQLTSLMALRYGATVVRQGYADVLLVGAAEEFTAHAAWGFHHAGLLKNTDTLVGEGCVVFVVEEPASAAAAGRRPLAEILACEMGVYGELGHDAELPRGLATCIQRALQRTGVAPDEVWAVAGCSTGNPMLDEAEAQGLALALHDLPPERINVKQQVGECYSAAGAFQLAALLSTFRTTPNGADRYGLVTSIGYTGAVGCALVKACA